MKLHAFCTIILDRQVVQSKQLARSVAKSHTLQKSINAESGAINEIIERA
jgi:hypothetical protein